MPEPLTVPAATTPPATTPPATPDLSGIKSTIDTLNSTLNEITERLDTMEEDVNKVKEPIKPEEPPKWEPKSWDDVPKKAEEIAADIVEKKLQEKEDAIKQAGEDEKAKQQAIDQDFDKTLAELETSGKIPKVEKPDDENDPGRQARRELFGLGVHFDSPNLTKMAELREVLSKQGYKYDPKTDKLLRVNAPPTYSVNAPVSGGSKAISSDGKPSYKDIHNKSMDTLIREFNQG